MGIPARVLIVAGSDPIAGAGAQADLKVMSAFGVYGMTAITAITVQDTRRVARVEPVSAGLVVEQMRACLEEIGADCIKLGMLATRETVEAVAELLSAYPEIPVVADPVLAGTGGGRLLEPEALESYRRGVVARATVLTPNLPEAAALTGLRVTGLEEMKRAAERLRALGARHVWLTGGHLEGEWLSDWLDCGEQTRRFEDRRLSGPGFHGTGCVLASAIAAGVARGWPVMEAVERGRRWLRESMVQSVALGKGQRLLWRHDRGDHDSTEEERGLRDSSPGGAEDRITGAAER